MNDAVRHETAIGNLLHRACRGEDAALNELIQHSGERLTSLTRRMLRGFPGVRRWSDTDDVLQNALLRLSGALQAVKPSSPRDYFALATLQIRRELIDLARRFSGPEGLGANHDTRGANSSAGNADKSDHTHEPSELARWSELHQQIDGLPDDEREVVGLLFYQELTQERAAELLGLSVRTVQRRWHAALWKLHRIWNDDGE